MRSLLFLTVACFYLLPVSAQISEQDPKSTTPSNTSSGSVKSELVKTKIDVNRISICLDIKDNEPDVIDSVFPSEVKRLYCFTHIKGAENCEIQHRWYYNDDLQSTVSLKIGSESWRTYSIKSIPKVFTGEWMVAIVNSKNEEVLKTCKFIIKP